MLQTISGLPQRTVLGPIGFNAAYSYQSPKAKHYVPVKLTNDNNQCLEEKTA